MKKFIEPTPEQRRQLLNEYGVPYDRIVREKERRDITSLCRSSAWVMEQSGNYPRRRKVGRGGVGWLLSDLLHWIYQQ
ncbi:TPA: AlpA family phage regulatory protein [Klebsiella pneumoniae]|uniref:helix-turn-helix transcriptional regulator n=1 Tax=Klebsiella TaxID=570 RepID=UPI00109C9DDA|nr:AlpA family phage regulatory protein [Klebsiella variicola]HBQ6750688.1 AlpA family phage regulatory protein [Klebsiella pneumoniae]HDE1484879.1 AlpA family phage regulatory protein [Klebsiella quasipneumoniae]HDU5077398.1 AlpA family phage regulatory protein [Klebsiella quasipneumoniae subsp. similipneumoniae]HBQ6761556.1 AlpA family phage regulatory protein [Klebsiella pneumoniae]HBX6374734.1 AlpA family phage regulatory protein [Klebsiella pneumoniae]